MANLTKITREGILAAIEECERIGESNFVTRYRCRPSNRYMVEHRGGLYPSKPIVCSAFAHSTGGLPLSPRDFSGGPSRLGGVFERNGFALVEVE